MDLLKDYEGERGRLGPLGRILLGVFLAGQMTGQVFLLLICWPAVTSKADPPTHTLIGYPLTQEVALILCVAILGAMGGSTHALSSYARFVGNRNLVRSWVWWYVLRAPIGVSLAVVLYFVVQGGLLGGNTGDGNVNPYGIGALAALAGLCSEAATNKLSELFETMFRSDKRPDKDPLSTSAPRVESIRPAEVKAGSGDTTITITGGGFCVDDVARAGTERVEFRAASPIEGVIVAPAKLLAAAGELEIMVCRAANSSAQSVPIKLRIT
ncbi:MAG: hypothetical protein IT435_13030 [Phycisphaerales bacterium]|nr:hypothetical protein [Phycisphaerales bacterium]